MWNKNNNEQSWKLETNKQLLWVKNLKYLLTRETPSVRFNAE